MAKQAHCEIEGSCERRVANVCGTCGRVCCQYHTDSATDEWGRDRCLWCVPVMEAWQEREAIEALLWEGDDGQPATVD